MTLPTARRAILLAVLCGCGPLAAQPPIYTCVDANGRRITSDRPIYDCIDREQRILNPSGTLRGTLSPSYTAKERAEREEKARQEALARQREIDQRQRERALLTRYPRLELLERERAAALAAVDEQIALSDTRSATLVADRRKLESEAEFYAKAPSRMPATLKRAIADNQRQLKEQEAFVADQRAEKRRIEQRFDDMRRELERLWGQQAAARDGGR